MFEKKTLFRKDGGDWRSSEVTSQEQEDQRRAEGYKSAEEAWGPAPAPVEAAPVEAAVPAVSTKKK